MVLYKSVYYYYYYGALACSGISWTICKQSARGSSQITTIHLITQFLQADALLDAQPTVSKHWRQALKAASVFNEISCHVSNILASQLHRCWFWPVTFPVSFLAEKKTFFTHGSKLWPTTLIFKLHLNEVNGHHPANYLGQTQFHAKVIIHNRQQGGHL